MLKSSYGMPTFLFDEFAFCQQFLHIFLLQTSKLQAQSLAHKQTILSWYLEDFQHFIYGNNRLLHLAEAFFTFLKFPPDYEIIFITAMVWCNCSLWFHCWKVCDYRSGFQIKLVCTFDVTYWYTLLEPCLSAYLIWV